MASFGNVAGGALSSASQGASLGSVVPGIGTAIGAGVGGLVGLISGLFGDDDAPEQYEDPTKASRLLIAKKLMSGDAGNRVASMGRADATRDSQLAMEAMGNKLGTTNAAVQGGLYNNLMRESQEASTRANVKGAMINTDNSKAASDILGGVSTSDFSQWRVNQERADQPSLYEQLFSNTATTLTGSLAGGLGKKLAGSLVPEPEV